MDALSRRGDNRQGYPYRELNGGVKRVERARGRMTRCGGTRMAKERVASEGNEVYGQEVEGPEQRSWLDSSLRGGRGRWVQR